MKVYPVRYFNTAPDASMKHVRVKPFTSLTDARQFRTEVSEKEGISACILDVEEYTLNKAGVIDAFNRGQKLMLESEFCDNK